LFTGSRRQSSVLPSPQLLLPADDADPPPRRDRIKAELRARRFRDDDADGQAGAMPTIVEPPLVPAGLRGAAVLPGQARQIMEASLDAIVLVDGELRVVGWNAAAEATFGWSAADALGREVVDLVPERLRGTYRLGLPAAMDPDAELPALRNRFETVAVGSDGVEFPIELAMTVMDNGEDRILVACVRDISDRHTVSAQVAAGESHTRFVANMSHELRTPLNSVLGFAQLLGRDPELSERQRRYVDHIMQGGSHLLGVIDDILDLDRIGAGRAELHVEPVAFGPLLDSVVERLSPLAATSGVRVQPLVAGSPEIHSDRRRLSQIITNLLANAIQFTPDGGQVTIAARALDQTVEIAVTDTGVGIPLAEQERIFDPFTQVDSRLSRSHAGTGLGLSLSRRLASLLGGELTVSSVVGSGSTFRLVLPLARSV
jgi:PAS domain S-box-containing protein